MLLKVVLQKTSICLASGRRRMDGKSESQIEYSYHIEVRTLNARRMFRENAVEIRLALKWILSDVGKQDFTDSGFG